HSNIICVLRLEYSREKYSGSAQPACCCITDCDSAVFAVAGFPSAVAGIAGDRLAVCYVAADQLSADTRSHTRVVASFTRSE
ncbi:hypothetical protein, partial [Thiolapillus sp.]|uniref:hypothetical protein n=1 Tax=Thiolapillus sp. TaxID=2017437 RepID=UPI003AF7CD7B